MRPDSDETDVTDEIDVTSTPTSGDAPRRPLVRAVARAVRRVVTPAVIVVAWWMVVGQWGASEEALFNWATATAGVVLGVVTIAWLLSLRFGALRRALLPFEGGLVVGAIVLAWATTGVEVDMLGDRIAVAFAFGVIAALLLAFMQQLVAGRRRAGAWLTGVVVVCAAAGIAVPSALDWLDGPYPEESYASDMAGEVVARASADGFRLDNPLIGYATPALASGYVADPLMMDGGMYAEPAVMIDPATNEPLVGSPSAGALPAPVASSSISNDWAQLLAQPDGSLRLAVRPDIATGVDGSVKGSLRRGSCGTAADSREVLSLSLGSQGVRRFELDMQVDDLQLDDQLSLIVGTARPLAPTRCIELLTGSGIALAQLGAATFAGDCLKPLDLPRGSEYLVRPSSFQDPSCASRFEQYADVASSLLVTADQLKAYRACHRQNEAGVPTTERKLPNGAAAFAYRDYVDGICTMYASNQSTYGPYAPSGVSGYPVVDPATGLEYQPSPHEAPGAVEGPMSASIPPPTAAAPAAPVAPVASPAVTEDLDGLTPEELAAKVR